MTVRTDDGSLSEIISELGQAEGGKLLAPRVSDSELKLKWAKLAGYAPDFVVSGGSKTDRADRRFLMHAFTCIRRAEEPSIVEELHARGYDLKGGELTTEHRRRLKKSFRNLKPGDRHEIKDSSGELVAALGAPAMEGEAVSMTEIRSKLPKNFMERRLVGLRWFALTFLVIALGAMGALLWLLS